MTDSFAQQLADSIVAATGLPFEQVSSLLEKPKNLSHGDLAFPCFALAKAQSKNPTECAKQLAQSMKLPVGITEVSALGPFLNFRFDRELVAAHVLNGIRNAGSRLGCEEHSSETILVEYSSPNIAKPFHVGHLRATLIGNCLHRVVKHLGYQSASINHLGDWGTQFGFVWTGCKLWGKPESATVESLVELYRRASALRDEQAEKDKKKGGPGNSEANEMARKFFIDLEDGKDYAVDFWRWCSDISLKYLEDTYSRLNVRFDHYTGESFYSPMLEEVTNELKQAKLLTESQGATGVDLGEELGFARVTTPDGRSLYLARDIAAAMYRAKTFAFTKSIYVVGMPQALHFKQLIEILTRLDKPFAKDMVHVAFGHVLGMKTRGSGEFVELNGFLDEAYERALKAYQEQVSKRPEGLDEKAVAHGVALSGIIFSNLSRNRLKDVHFSWESALEFQGDSGPYILYAYARINGILEKALAQGLKPAISIDSTVLTDESAYRLIIQLADFNAALSRTFAELEPAHLASYLLELAKLVSKAYLDLKVVGEEQHVAENRLALFESAQNVIGLGLNLLGITPLPRM